MAELLIVVVAAGLVLLYAADRARKLRARGRQMAAMNDRLDAAAAKVDEQQERKQARVRASAELTSVMPAIKRPPLTLPGVPVPGAEPDEDAAPDADGAPAAGDSPVLAEGPGADEVPAGDPPAGEAPAEDGPAAGEVPAVEAPAGEVAAADGPSPEGTLTMDQVIPDAVPVPRLEVTFDGTLIMPAVPGQPRTGQQRASQPRGHQEQGNRH